MDFTNYKAHELKDLISKKEVSVEEVTKAHLENVKNIDAKVNAFLYIAEEEALNDAKALDEKLSKGEDIGLLGGAPLGIKDNISVKNMQNTCASKILEGYISPYDATVSESVKSQGGVILGKLNMDEFAMGSSTENSAYKITRNPWDLDRVPGGSSGGSAAAVASKEVPLALGTDTGGSVRQPASFCGIVGLKPTYGRVSRSGVVAYGSTLDQVGTLGRDVKDCALLTQVISGVDHRDFTTANINVPNYENSLSENIKGKKIALPKEFFKDGLDPKVQKSIYDALEVFKANGAEITEVSLPLADYAISAYYLLACAEASSNLARFDGVRYGHRSESVEDAVDVYFKSRSEAFGKEVKKRIMLGTYALSAGYYDAYYKKALKVRNLIKGEFENIFKDFDAIISPTAPTPAYKIGEKTENALEMYLGDIYTVPVNIAGIPAISLPCGVADGLPVGLQIMGNYFKEDTLFNLAYSYEQSTKWHEMHPNL
ncbi:Asp-tRNA(Asn)/Glu-tRNA(Gln) amidotransferase subunit GatA [Clostridium botulinum]|uniref:Glutamyl-tRNA(Gln) amidotransferase subunit A n=2 Tax=Clostridium botulinum TaxID=1491 RepID=GATA_CLOBA|nr:Asp-tRNA(Asn)/Glu-tRNA(Gln) amidotransferase subunit GatA [Clostridium botulinum]B2UZ26.1 RecName: Full=Glutamyl-tRNA(Gln) amidotransferase subunit A; Short=Glu-ADT subunit A [Clostridium botulinum E3 str. Alaska E43]ACD51059.1 glutamyl-tRNA(Gln) amidotransferase subunit A [Clostridium botulinum E3 str. Alaska E43]AJF28480.1 glutamyl-tRNA amidotransferase [Clostridium botulinum]AJF31541.1 glutamyl-tRNA amidotransferase [Clostridium botulinum]KAI3349912.1 Asp-tRNA(Asn)/Glu-tRNA(Gln) amidotra